MFYLCRKLGDVLDAVDLGGWLCLVLGMGILGLTVLLPAWMDVQQMRYERSLLSRQAAVLQARYDNYQSFVQAVDRDDPVLLRRLAWHHLRLKPGDGVVAEAMDSPVNQSVSVDQWMGPSGLELPPPATIRPVPDTRLTRLILGPPRPWVLAFGGWLVLVGILLNPQAPPRLVQGASAASAASQGAPSDELE